MSEIVSWSRPGYRISIDPGETDLDVVCGFLQSSYWASDLSRDCLERSFEPALVYNLLIDPGGGQVGFARVVTDRMRIAWLSDVFVLDTHRGRGLGKWLVGSVLADPRLATVKRWLLATADAHGLYRQHGWVDSPPGRYMLLDRS